MKYLRLVYGDYQLEFEPGYRPDPEEVARIRELLTASIERSIEQTLGFPSGGGRGTTTSDGVIPRRRGTFQVINTDPDAGG